MNLHILDPEVQAFLKAHKLDSPAAIALQKSPFPELSSSVLAGQIDAAQRAKKKIPLWESTAGIYFPEKLNMEQCSSEQTALFKQSLIEPNTSLIDMTGGFGVDSYYFSQQARQVVHCEINPELSAIVKHNMQRLNATNVECYSGDATHYLQQDLQVDYIYSDPSRRVNQKKVFLLSDCEPNIVALQDQLWSKTRYIITKVAPLLDISAALKELKKVAQVYIISLDNDCKELLFVQDQQTDQEPEIRAVKLSPNNSQIFQFTYSEEQAIELRYADPKGFLYEPDVSLTKAGAFKSIAQQYGLHKVAQHSHIYSAETLVSDFIGKIFRIQQVQKYGQFKKSKNFEAGNVVAKNFPIKAEELKKKHKIKDDKSHFYFFSTNAEQELIVISASRVA